MDMLTLYVRAVHTGRHLIVSYILIMHQRNENLMHMMFKVDQNSLDRFQEAPMFAAARSSNPELFKALVHDSGIAINLLLGHKREQLAHDASQKFVDTPLSLILSSQNYILIDVLVHLNNLFYNCCLTTVDLSYTNTSSLPAELFKLCGLHHLNMSNNRLSELSLPNINHWPNILQLRNLVISNNSLEHVPLELFRLSCLETLDVSHNPLKTLPKKWWAMKNLVILDVSFTHLESLSIETDPATSQIMASSVTLRDWIPVHGKRSAFQMEFGFASPNRDRTGSVSEDTADSVLKFLNASHCNLKTFPKFLALFFPSLEKLDLSYNKLQFCCAINELPTSLSILDVSNNLLNNAVRGDKVHVFYYSARLSMISDCMCHMDLRNLHTLKLANNIYLKHVRISDESILGDGHVFFPKLMILDLSNCGLQQSPRNLAGLQDITDLNLSHNSDLAIPLEVHSLENLVNFDYEGIRDPITNELNKFSQALDKQLYLHETW